MTTIFLLSKMLLLFFLSLILLQFGWGLFMVPVFGLHDITVYQAFGLLILSRFLVTPLLLKDTK